MAFRSAARSFCRGFHTSRVARGGAAPWGTEVNEPGGRLFGEKILAPGERRKVQDWEVPYIGTMVSAVVILYFGLGSRPKRNINVWAREEALERLEAREAAAATSEE